MKKLPANVIKLYHPVFKFPSSSPSELPKTANIKPIASSPASLKPHTVPVQPQSGASKVTASIRPMAITPATSTPTATVMPTTVNQPEVAVEG